MEYDYHNPFNSDLIEMSLVDGTQPFADDPKVIKTEMPVEQNIGDVWIDIYTKTTYVFDGEDWMEIEPLGPEGAVMLKRLAP